MSVVINSLGAALLTLVLGCGADAQSPSVDGRIDGQTRDTTTAPDVDVEAGEVLVSDIDADGDVVSETDDVSDASDGEVDGEPITCEPGHACNVRRDGSGRCPGRCVRVDDRLACRGVIVDAVCHPSDPRIVDATTFDADGLRVVVVDPPARAQVGDVDTVAVEVHNDSGMAIRRGFGSSWSAAWEVLDMSFADWNEITVAGGASRSLTMTVRAVAPDVLDGTGGRVVTFYIGDAQVELHAGVAFAPDAPVGCGGFVFPDDIGRCCDDVFFPGALCCASDDCPGGACADGHCVTDVPALGQGRPIHGVHEILVVVADAPELAPDDDGPCVDRSDPLAPRLGLDVVTAFFEERVAARLGRDAVDFRWTVLAGIDSDDVVAPGPERWAPFYRVHLAAYLAARAALGCPRLDDFDEVIIASGQMDLHGYGGLYLGDGLVATSTWSSPWLFAHELGHAFGATDLGPLFGNRFLWTRALMGTHGAPDATDDVAWAQWGLADIDGSGVVDLAELAAFPEDFEVGDVRADVVEVGTFGAPELRLSWIPIAKEGDDVVVLDHDAFHVRLPEHGWERDWTQPGRRKTIAFQHDELQWEALRARGAVTVHWTATHAFTGRTGARASVALDVTRDVKVAEP